MTDTVKLRTSYKVFVLTQGFMEKRRMRLAKPDGPHIVNRVFSVYSETGWL